MCLFCIFVYYIYLFFFKQKTAYEMRISDWSSDVCSSDLEDASDDAADHDHRVRLPREQDGYGSRACEHVDQSPCDQGAERSEERRVGKECDSTCRSRG